MNNQSLNYMSFLKFKKKPTLIKSKKIAVITGGSGRIGSVFLNELVFNDYICICLNRSRKNIDDLIKFFPKEKQKNILWFKFDSNNSSDIDSSIKKIKKKFKYIDCLINCASSSNRGKNFKYNFKNYSKELNGVFGSSFLLTEKILPLLRKTKSGKIINVGSLWGRYSPKFDTYLDMDIGPTPLVASGKAALIQYTKYLAARESIHNIKSNCLVPGWFPRKGKIERKDYIRNIKKNIPIGRIGKLEDLISAVSFLLSPHNDYYNGQELFIDGGYNIY